MSSGGRGHKSGHKGQRRHFTNPDDLVAEQEKQAREKQWRKRQGEDSDDSDDGEAGSKSSESDSSSDDEASGKAKGVEGLIEVENPNRVVNKTKKISQLDSVLVDAQPELSRREREEIEKQRAKDSYQKLHAAGKTDDARADLARLALIKQQREQAAKKREEEIKAREALAKNKAENLNKALGKNKKT